MQALDMLPDLSTWLEYKRKTSYFGKELPHFESIFYRAGEGEETLSAGVFYIRDTLTHIAWGVMSEPHCSFHAVALENGDLSEPIEGCPTVLILYEEGEAVGYELRELGRTFVWK